MPFGIHFLDLLMLPILFLPIALGIAVVVWLVVTLRAISTKLERIDQKLNTPSS